MLENLTKPQNKKKNNTLRIWGFVMLGLKWLKYHIHQKCEMGAVKSQTSLYSLLLSGNFHILFDRNTATII